ncbi:MAG TPA: hypothetical protein VJV23_00970 [Candidatus Polarisedimenticolia bacterium]|nr:hypothetical protein [Candidatus Polarisedimenticolia bacterium]
MRSSTGGRAAGRAARLAALGLLCLTAAPAALARQEATPSLTFYPALHLKFVDAQARNYFRVQSGVVNVSGAPMTELVLVQRFPDGFTPRLVGPEEQVFFKRPEGFSESLEGNVYTMRLPELRIAEATALVLELSYQGRPAAVTFPAVEVEYLQGGERRKEKGPDQTWDLSKYTKYSGTLREFIKRYAGMDLRIPNEQLSWGFSGLAARAAGKVATGPVEIDADGTGRMRFSLQAGTPGELRQLMLIKRPSNPARDPKANDEVRRLVMDMVQSTADFTLDADDFSVRKQKLGRWNAWVAETRWRDRVKDRLGEGPSRWYVFTDEKQGSQYVINISAQGRGAGAALESPNPEREKELMAELEGIVASIRLL